MRVKGGETTRRHGKGKELAPPRGGDGKGKELAQDREGMERGRSSRRHGKGREQGKEDTVRMEEKRARARRSSDAPYRRR